MAPSARSTPTPRHPLPTRPDPSSQLLEAVRQRDPHSSLLLAQRWVHRRGLASLEGFRHGTLTANAGDEASAWLAALLEQPGAAAAGQTRMVHAPGPTKSEEGPQPLAPVVLDGEQGACHGLPLGRSELAEPAQVEQRVISEVDAAIAAMLATFGQEELGSALPRGGGGMGAEAAEACAIAAVSLGARPADRPEDWPAIGEPDAVVDRETPFVWPSGSVVAEGADPGEAPSAGEGEKAKRADVTQKRIWPEEVPEVAPQREGLRQRLRRRLPAAAGMLRNLLSAAEPVARWTGAALQVADPAQPMEEEHAEASCPALADGERGETATALDLIQPQNAVQPQTGLEPQNAVEPEGPFLTSSGLGLQAMPPTAAPAPTAAERLRQRISRPSAARTDLSPPAPRPSGLADLGSWLPDGALPRAS